MKFLLLIEFAYSKWRCTFLVSGSCFVNLVFFEGYWKGFQFYFNNIVS